MVRVLRRELGTGKWTAATTCQVCWAILEFEESDLRIVNVASAYVGEIWEPELAIRCPECHTDILVTDTIRSDMKRRRSKAA